jgi:hypothetical protein
MLRSLALLTLLLSGVPARAQYKAEDVIYDFKCAEASKCALKCWNSGTMVEEKYVTLRVYQYKEHPRRIWYKADGIPHILGDDSTCNFGALPVTPIGPTPQGTTPGTPVPSTSLDTFKPGKSCIGAQCFGPK